MYVQWRKFATLGHTSSIVSVNIQWHNFKLSCSFVKDYCGETVEDLRDSIASQNKKICHLQKKLENYLEVVVERDSLQELCYGFDQWKNEIENHHKKIYCELNTALDLQKERFSKVLAAEREWENMVTELQYSHDCMCNQLKTHKSNEHRLQSQLAESEKSLECVQDELCRTKVSLAFFWTVLFRLWHPKGVMDESLLTVRFARLDELTSKKKIDFKFNSRLRIYWILFDVNDYLYIFFLFSIYLNIINFSTSGFQYSLGLKKVI